MALTLEETAKKIVRLPHDFRRGDKSAYTLLKESGYFKNHPDLNESLIITALNEQPDCVNDWLQYSADQRSSRAWYFKKSGQEKYFVGHHPDSPEFPGIDFTNSFEACAAFIKRYIERVRT